MKRKKFVKFFFLILAFFSFPFLVGAEKNFVPGSSKVVEGRKVYAEQCSPCHVDFNRFKRPNLIFKHGYHQLVPCEACHEVYPHSPDKTVRPKMRACLACHSLYHKGKLIARGDCLVCHYEAKKPSFHTPGWEKEGHVKENPKKCVDCHQPNFCESCHAKKNVPPLPPNSYALPTVAQPLFTLNLSPPIKMENCSPCHKDLDAFKNDFLIFKHNIHLEKGYDCSACHQEKAHQPDKVSRPKMEVCYSCHAQPHLNLKKRIIATENCYACHPKGKMRLPYDHTYLFRTKEHSSYAKKNLSYCYMCHKESFCQNCHLRERVIPADHEVKNWKDTHGRGKYSRVSACTPCHSQKKFCYKCHPVEMPHPLDWLMTHGEAGRVSIEVCRTCHKQRGLEDYCQSCHHTEVAGAFLKRENCVKCHPQFRLHFLKLRQEDYAIHAAHFDISGRDPFECFECHKKKYEGTAISKFEVCKECHGKERLGRLVAPYNVDNGELCSRCHKTSKRGISIPRLY